MWDRPISEPTDSQKIYRQAVTHLRNGNARMAIELCEKSLRSFPGDANILCLAAKANLVLRQFGESQARAEEAIRLFPYFSTAHEILGDSLLDQGRAKAARKAYERIETMVHSHFLASEQDEPRDVFEDIGQCRHEARVRRL